MSDDAMTTEYCGSYTVTYSETNLGETFPFSSPKFQMDTTTVSFYSDDMNDIDILDPNPFSLTITVSLTEYPSIQTQDVLQVNVRCVLTDL